MRVLKLFKYKIVNGFTLIEVLAAISILSIVLVSLFKMHAQTISMNSRVVFNSNASLLASSKISEIEKKGDTSSGSGDFGEDFPGYTWTASMEDVTSEEVGEFVKELKKIQVTVLFNQGEFSYSLRSYIYVSKQ